MKKKNSVLRKIKKRVRRSTLFFLFLTLMANAFAWFIYSNKVSNQITTGVKSWKITFEQGGSDLTSNVTFEIDSIYPGMTPFQESIEIHNAGEMVAYITYEIESIKILDEVYSKENYTQSELSDILNNNYPFKTSFTVDQDQIEIGDTGTFSVHLNWQYESGNDEQDTYWGKKSYSYKEQFPSEKQIVIVVKMTASQKKPQA